MTWSDLLAMLLDTPMDRSKDVRICVRSLDGEEAWIVNPKMYIEKDVIVNSNVVDELVIEANEFQKKGDTNGDN